jgi:MSHA biogenesis protein MshM
VWRDYWKLSFDPFLGPNPRYVSTGTHDEVVARLVQTIESAQRLAVLRGAEGLGKSVVLARMAAEVRRPGRRLAMVVRPADGLALISGLAEGLGMRLPAGSRRAVAWKALADAIRVCHWQKVHPILVVDDVGDLGHDDDRHDLARLVHVGTHPASPLTVVQAVCESDDEWPPSDWQLSIRLQPLMRSETAQYVVAKLATSGRNEPAFTPQAMGRLHDLSAGRPRGIDRLASLALMASAWRRLERVTPEVVDGVAHECQLPRDGFAA